MPSPPTDDTVRLLCQRVVAAPEGSEEFKAAVNELHTLLKDSAASARQKIAVMREVQHGNGKSTVVIPRL